MDIGGVKKTLQKYYNLVNQQVLKENIYFHNKKIPFQSTNGKGLKT
jgi:hypothetical protein